MGGVADYVRPQPGESEPSVVEIDLLDSDHGHGPRVRHGGRPDVAHLQYTSGSTRQPAGVIITNENASSPRSAMPTEIVRRSGYR